MLFSARVFYGLGTFFTITQSEIHSALIIRLSRYRRSDPGISAGCPEIAPWIGKDAPSLQGDDPHSGDEAV